MSSPASFVLLFQETVIPKHELNDVSKDISHMKTTHHASPVTNPACLGTMTKTGTREERDQDIDAGAEHLFPGAGIAESVSLGTQTFTKTAREEPDQDAWRGGNATFPAGPTAHHISMGTHTRTDSREETDQDMGMTESGTPFAGFSMVRPSTGPGTAR